MELKCVVVGDAVAEKTTLLAAYVSIRAPSEPIPKVFDRHDVTVMVGGEPYLLQLFDTAGQEDYERLRPLVYPQTDVLLVCFSVAEPASFKNVREKIHLRDDPKIAQKRSFVTPKQGAKLAQELGAAAYVECSAAPETGVKRVFDEALLAALEPTVAPPKKDHSCRLV